tara:strand:+ start:19268 stop:24478 length:5211 start_codon:yes stop_codon:yes gene_type:complete
MKKNLFFSLSLIIILGINIGAQGDIGTEDELKVKANELFVAENYKEAKLMYAQLLSLYPKDPTYNYRFGACVLQTEADKTKPMKYLSFAASKANVDPLAYFYLGRAYHLNYEFAKAVKLYSKFKNKASNEEKEKYSVERQIEMCKNGKNLLTKLKEIQVLEIQSIAEKDFYRIYDENTIGGKILAVPEQFKSKYDKKINDKSVVFLANNTKQLYYSSYGKKGENGKDIYKAIKLGNGEWSEGVSLGNSINTSYDEDFAYIKPDGRTLYFASKGHSSMGGYDIFRSVLDDATGLWSEPENLDFAFNSAADDFMFVTDQEEIVAYFTSNRVNEFGEVTVYKVLIEKAPAELSVISGSFIAEGSSGLRKVTITVIDKETQETIGVYETDENGKYSIEIAKNGGEYQFNVETNEVDPIHTGVVSIPKQDEFEVLGQELRLVGTGNEQQLVIKNIFDGSTANNIASAGGPTISSPLIKLKANLEVNYNSDNLASLKEMRKGAASDGNDANQADDSKVRGVSGVDSGSELVENNTNGSVNNTESVKGATGIFPNSTLSAVTIKEDISSLKANRNRTIDSKQKAIGLQYAAAIKLEKESATLFDKASAMEANGSQTAEIELKQREAGVKALKASIAAKLAKELEASINEDLQSVDELETSELGITQSIGENNLLEATTKLNELKSKINGIKTLEGIIKATLSDIDERNQLAQRKVDDFSAKAKSFSEEENDLKNQIISLKKQEGNARGKGKEELAKNIENTELDLKDLKYQSGFINENLMEANLMKKSLSVEKAEILAASSNISSASNDQVQVSEEEKNQLFSQLKKYLNDDKLAYDPNNKMYSSFNVNSIDEEGSTNERSVLKTELDQLSASINEQQKFKDDAESELARRESGQFVADNTPITKASDITATSVVKDDFTNLEFDQRVQATSTLIGIQLIEAKKALFEAGELAKQQKIAEESAYTLPTPAERTKAFFDANQLKKESEAKQIEAANKFAKFNLKEYQFNKAKIYEASEIDERYTTEGRDIAELLAEEADNFYKDAAILRLEIKSTDRFSQKEVNLQKAYDYEVLALKKQQEALKKLRMVVNEALTVSANEESISGAKPFIQVIDDEEILAVVEAPKAKASAEQKSAQVISVDENIIKQDSIANEMKEGASRDSVIALVEDLQQEREQLLREAALYYERERQIKEGLVGVKSADKSVTAQVLAPGKSTFEVLLDTVDVDADREELILSSEAFKAFANNRQELVIQSKVAEVAYQEALALANENNRLQKQAVVELSKVKVVKDEDEKQRLIKSAEVIENTIKENEEKIETINLQIKVKNFLFQSLLDKDKSYLSKLSVRERQEYATLSAEYVPEIQSDRDVTDLSQSLPVYEKNTSSLGRDETAQQTSGLNPLKPANSNEAKVADIDDNIVTRTPVTDNNSGETGSDEIEKEPTPVIIDEVTKVREVSAPKVNSPDLSSNEGSAIKVENIDIIPREVKQAIFVTLNSNESAYSENKPIPTKTSLPEGIVYKVQVGAFRNEIPPNTFKGFAPIMAEATGTGITRYTAGLFANLNNATAARDKIRKIGYPDAFVVAFLNSERISISKARAEGFSNSTSPTTTNFPKISSNTSINGNSSVASAEQVTQVPGGSKEALPNGFDSGNIEEVINAKTVEGLYYTIQVGVFSAPLKKGVFNYEGLNVVQLESGLFRYNAGMFNSVLQAADLKNTITVTIKDAFVTAYYNGKRISLTEASKLKN